MKKTESLQNKLLIAMPSLADPYFSQAVVYIYEHDETGATGFIINKPTNIMVSDVLSRTEIPCTDPKNKNRPMLLGGPVKQEQLFLIFYDREKDSVGNPFCVSSSRDLLTSMGSGQHENMMAFLGYAAWEAGQLENEIKQNSWLVASANYDLLYNVPFSRRYGTAASLIGFNFSQLSDQVGHA